MDRINFQNNVTKLDKEMFDTFQNNIEKSAVVVSTTQPTTKEKVWFKKGKNLFNKNNFVSIESYIDGKNGEIKPYTGYTKMLILPINGGNSYTISRTAGKHFRAGTTSSYPVNGVTVSNFKVNNTGTSITVIAGANDKYLVCSYYQQGVDTITATAIESSLQIEPGSKASAYEAYIEPKLYVKNNNGVYEEFVEEMQGAGDILVNTSEITVNEFCKRNKVCTLSVEMKLAQDLSANASVKIMSGFPKPAISGKFTAIYGANKVCKMNLTNKALYLWYNSTAITSGDYLSIYVTYMTE